MAGKALEALHLEWICALVLLLTGFEAGNAWAAVGRIPDTFAVSPISAAISCAMRLAGVEG